MIYSYQMYFYEACMRGNLEEVKYINTLKGVDPSARGNCAIKCAASNGHLEVVKYLLNISEVRKGYI